MKNVCLTCILIGCLVSCACRSSRPSNKNNTTSYSIDLKKEGSNIEDIGYTKIPDTIPSLIFKRIGYTVSYNIETKQPNWVTWNLTADKVIQKKEGVWNDYVEDIKLDNRERATNEDYINSGFDRGHMCPGGDCNWDNKAREETFLLSNMCPQNPNLNRGDWKEIEIACRKWAKRYGNIYIVCGPIFLKSQKHKRIGPNQIPVPEAFFKVVLCAEPSNPKGIGFICRNTDGNRKKDFYVNSIRQVERVTGYRFFPNIAESIKKAVYDMDDLNEW